MKKQVIGLLAHVDAGKTTLAESLLYNSGAVKNQGRVDDKNTAMDFHTLEKERGITIFSSQALFTTDNFEISLVDTPGHVDFSCETERTLRILDAAILVVSGINLVQSHTKTLWNLLKFYNIPTFVFVTKMDYSRFSNEELLKSLQKDLSEDCIDFTDINSDDLQEKAAAYSEELLDKFISGIKLTVEDYSDLIYKRDIFPVFFGSGLKNIGTSDFINSLDILLQNRIYPDIFGARVYKISHDKETRLTHLKVTGGELKVKDTITINGKTEKINRIRIYTGGKYKTVDCVPAGMVCAVEGLESCESGTGLGYENDFDSPVLEPVMTYRINPPKDMDIQKFLPMLKEFQEEEPSLNIKWNTHIQQIQVGLMGDIQAEILKSLISDKYGIETTINEGQVQYKETITDKVEGIGHYEPLRHYSEVHLILEPLPRGSGLKFESRCKEDLLDKNWQRLIMTHLNEKEHLGVLTGSVLTDVKIILAAGRAHLKHTEGGDFRQSTYRAVRQGLMKANSVLLEPWYNFTLTIPYEQLGRAISDIRMRSGTFNAPDEQNEMAVIRGKAPISEMNGYASELAAYTSGKGQLSYNFAGYDICHNSEKVIEQFDYNPESDLENTPDSVFCAHGAGFTVKWNQVEEYMHLGSCLKDETFSIPSVNHRNLRIDDKELELIMEREFGPVKYNLYRPAVKEEKQEVINERNQEAEKYIIVDGYNVIFAWEDLKELAKTSLASARERLMNILSNYSAFTKEKVILVFDAYKVPGNTGEKFDYHNIHIVYTKERELGDVYIERLVKEIGKNEKVRIVSSDGLIQLSAVRFGVLRLSSREFEEEVDEVSVKISQTIDEIRKSNPTTTIGEIK